MRLLCDWVWWRCGRGFGERDHGLRLAGALRLPHISATRERLALGHNFVTPSGPFSLTPDSDTHARRVGDLADQLPWRQRPPRPAGLAGRWDSVGDRQQRRRSTRRWDDRVQAWAAPVSELTGVAGDCGTGWPVAGREERRNCVGLGVLGSAQFTGV